LKPGGRYFVSDLRRDMSPLVVGLMKWMAQPKAIRPGLVSSINAAYTREELLSILQESGLRGYTVKQNVMGLIITGEKAN